MTALHDLTAIQQRDALARGEFTPTELTRHYLDRIERLDERLGAFITVTRDAALERAARLEDSGRPAPADADAQPPWGLPFADKDLVSRAGVRTTFGSRAFAEHVPERSDPFALALDATNGDEHRWCPRRIAMIVDRRIVVDQVAERGRKLLSALMTSSDAVVGEVAERLRSLTRTGASYVHTRPTTRANPLRVLGTRNRLVELGPQ